MDVEILPILCVGQTHRFVPTRFGLHGHGTPRPYRGGYCMNMRSRNP